MEESQTSSEATIQTITGNEQKVNLWNIQFFKKNENWFR